MFKCHPHSFVIYVREIKQVIELLELFHFIFLLIYKLTSLLAAIKFYRMAMQLVPDIEFKINYSRPPDADRGGGK